LRQRYNSTAYSTNSYLQPGIHSRDLLALHLPAEKWPRELRLKHTFSKVTPKPRARKSTNKPDNSRKRKTTFVESDDDMPLEVQEHLLGSTDSDVDISLKSSHRTKKTRQSVNNTKLDSGQLILSNHVTSGDSDSQYDWSRSMRASAGENSREIIRNNNKTRKDNVSRRISPQQTRGLRQVTHANGVLELSESE
jgi:hypothetical protein